MMIRHRFLVVFILVSNPVLTVSAQMSDPFLSEPAPPAPARLPSPAPVHAPPPTPARPSAAAKPTVGSSTPAPSASSKQPAGLVGKQNGIVSALPTKPEPSAQTAPSSSTEQAISTSQPPQDSVHTSSSNELFQRGYSAYQMRDYAEAQRLYLLGADKGDADCMHGLGYFYAEGLGVKRDYGLAQTWYQRSADHGRKEALYNIGLLYWQGGPGMPRDVQEAVRRFKLSADGGFSTSAFMIGRIYRDGDGVRQNIAEAMQWFKQAADQGYVDAMTELGGMYASGQGTLRDCATARRWFGMAASRGSVQAQAWLVANQSCS
jgi:TPR repeat protein